MPGGGGGGYAGPGDWEDQGPCPPVDPRVRTESLPCGSGFVYIPQTSTPAFDIADLIPLTSDEFLWLFANPARANELLNYLTYSTEPEKNSIAAKHLSALINDNDYRDFVNNYATSTGSTFMWFENQFWLNNPANFNLDVNETYPQGLTAVEKFLVAAYPYEAFIINENKTLARNESNVKFPSNGVINFGFGDKKDAFRHAYFQAINATDSRIGPTLTGVFATAHESETLIMHLMEAEMDIFNNTVGIAIAEAYPDASNFDLSTFVSSALAAGNLKYMYPLDYTNYYILTSVFWENPSTSTKGDGHHGINQIGTTILKPTNQ